MVSETIEEIEGLLDTICKAHNHSNHWALYLTLADDDMWQVAWNGSEDGEFFLQSKDIEKLKWQLQGIVEYLAEVLEWT